VYATKLANDLISDIQTRLTMLKNHLLFLLFIMSGISYGQNCQTDIYVDSTSGPGFTLYTADSASNIAVFYQWSNGATTPTINVSAPGNYCVTVTFGNGCTATDCFAWQLTGNCAVDIWQTTDSVTGQPIWQASGFPYYAGPWSYTWNNGDTGPTTPVGAPGLYCVTAISANGCIADTCVNTECNGSAFISTTSGSSPLSANSWISGPHTYLWSTGETTQEIYPQEYGYYCVTVTSSSGCTSEDCIYFSNQTPPVTCGIQMFGLHCSNGFYQISAFPSDFQFPIVSYSWNTGSNGPVLNVTEPGNYCVTTTNSEGCTASDCYNLCSVDSAWVHVALGQDSVNFAYPAEVYIIQYDTAQGGVLTGIDTLLTDIYGNVLVSDLPSGPFLIKAALLPDAPKYADYLPTYYLDKLIWSDAIPIHPLSVYNYWTGTCLVPHFYLPLIEGQNPGGPGFIGGLVSQGANFTGHGNDPEVLGEGDPYPGATLVLFTSDSIPVAAAVTDANGAYTFNNLPNGAYFLVLDIPGLAPVSVNICLGCFVPPPASVNFKVDENSIALSAQNIANELVVKAFPNPVNDYLWVETSAGARLTLRNTSGVTVSQSKATGVRTRLSLKDMPAGVYFLEVQEGSRIGVLKVAH
jgi:hypothetical protein